MYQLLLLCILQLAYTDGKGPLIWAVKLSHINNHTSIASQLGMTSVGPAIDLLEHFYEFHLPEKDHVSLSRDLGSHESALKYFHYRILSHPHVIWAEHQFALSREKKYINFNDPSFPQQWHLVSHVTVITIETTPSIDKPS